MSLNDEELERHCQYVLNKIRSGVVLLCEGSPRDSEGRLSPKRYGRMEEAPDANFYKACVPRAWRNGRPQFFICGDRVDVINSYFKILEICQENPDRYKLNPELLFALVDLDSCAAKFPLEGAIVDTEALFHNLYHNTNLDIEKLSQHQIWVTGFIYKEAYFLQPELQDVFVNFLQGTPQYQAQPLALEDLYVDIAKSMIPEEGSNALKDHFQTVSHRLRNQPELDTTTPEKLQLSWLSAFQNNTNPEIRRQLVRSLLTIQQVKAHWNKIQPPPDWMAKDWQFREQLSLGIGKWYAQQPATPDNHLACFFEQLHNKFQESRSC